MLIYSKYITPRLKYVTDFVAQEIDLIPWKITNNADDFRSFAGPRINYSNESFEDDIINILPQGLLNKTGINAQVIDCKKKEGLVIFFTSDYGFDMFAAIFYLLSRYEEYQPHQKDKYGRYAHENSLAFKENFIGEPLVNIWIKKFREFVAEKYPGYKFKKSEFIMMPTYDVDMAFSYKHKGLLRNAVNLLKDAALFRFKDIGKRVQVLNSKIPDPFDTFEWLEALNRKYKLHPHYFFLVAEKTGKHDKNIPPANPEMKNLISRTVSQNTVGLHPSFLSNSSKEILIKEKVILSGIVDKDIRTSRQHYLKLHLPDTYRNLIDIGIKHDYSMGYSGVNGFRASVASPFKWYDLKKEQETKLTIHPFCFMDATSLYYKKASPENALIELKQLFTAVKNVDGFFSMIWHNSSLSDENEFKGWKNMYASFIEFAGAG